MANRRLTKPILTLINLLIVSLTPHAAFGGGYGMVKSASIDTPIGKYVPCEAETVLSSAMAQTGINPFDGGANGPIWTCDNTRSGGSCPEPGATCYSNSKTKDSGICFKNPQLKIVMNGNEEVLLPRFAKLFVFTNNKTGVGNKTSMWETDESDQNCTIRRASVELGAVMADSGESLTRDACSALAKSVVSGGSLLTDQAKSSDLQFCDKTKANDPAYAKRVYARLKDLTRCFVAFPSLLEPAKSATTNRPSQPQSATQFQ